jgi:hypothetical protein
MAYNSINKLKLIWVIQEYYKERNKEGVMTVRIIQDINLIHPISAKCFYNWLGINARKLLKEADVDQLELNDLLRRFKEAIKL